jgi:hypothetical protein
MKKCEKRKSYQKESAAENEHPEDGRELVQQQG